MIQGRKIFIPILLLLSTKIFSQQADTLTLNQVINEYLSLISQNEKTENIADNLEELAEEKININSADYVELSQVPFLEYSDISKIIEYRKRKGKFTKLNQLKLAGINQYKFVRIKFFFRLNNKNMKSNKIKPITNKLRIRGINKPKKEQNNFFLNSKTYFRLITKYNKAILINAVVEKDYMENNFFDYKTANLTYSSSSILKKIIVGSYVVQFGQALALWSPYSFSKGSEIKSSTIKSGKILKPYRSANESKFFNGIAAKLRLWKFNLFPFYSNKKYDAILSSGKFSSISESGIHIDSSDLANSNSLNIKLLGSILEYKNNNVRVSFLYVNNNFSEFFSPNENIICKSQNYFSVEGKLRYENIFFAGELSYSQKAYAQLYSVNFSFTNNLSIVTVFRYYSPNYFSLWAQGFGEYGKTNNEKGFYTGVVLNLPYGKISAYADYFSIIEKTNRSPFPIGGRDFLIDYQSKKYLGNRLYIRVKKESKENYTDTGYETKQIIVTSGTKIRCAISSSVSKKIKLKTQGDVAIISNKKKSNGYALSETLMLRLKKFFIVGFISFFRTDDYDSRIYLYEYDLDGVFNNSMFYGNGARYYFLIKWKIEKSIKLQLKFSETFKLSSNYVDFVEENRYKTISLQIEYAPKFEF